MGSVYGEISGAGVTQPAQPSIKERVFEPAEIIGYDLERIFLGGLIEYVRSYCILRNPELKEFFETEGIKFGVEAGKLTIYREIDGDFEERLTFVLEATPPERGPSPDLNPAIRYEKLDKPGEKNHIQHSIQQILSKHTLNPKQKRALDIFLNAMDGPEEAQWWVNSLSARRPRMAPFLYDAFSELHRDEEQRFSTEKTWFELICFEEVSGGDCFKADQIYKWITTGISMHDENVSTDEFRRTFVLTGETREFLLPSSECVTFYYFYCNCHEVDPEPNIIAHCDYPPDYADNYFESQEEDGQE